jgi:hypothetical protein
MTEAAADLRTPHLAPQDLTLRPVSGAPSQVFGRRVEPLACGADTSGCGVEQGGMS